MNEIYKMSVKSTNNNNNKIKIKTYVSVFLVLLRGPTWKIQSLLVLIHRTQGSAGLAGSDGIHRTFKDRQYSHALALLGPGAETAIIIINK